MVCINKLRFLSVLPSFVMQLIVKEIPCPHLNAQTCTDDLCNVCSTHSTYYLAHGNIESNSKSNETDIDNFCICLISSISTILQSICKILKKSYFLKSIDGLIYIGTKSFCLLCYLL